MATRRVLDGMFTVLAVVVMLGAGSGKDPCDGELSNSVPKGQMVAKVESVLNEWARRSAAIKTVDVQFATESWDNAFHDTTHGVGRAVFKDANHAWYEVRARMRDGQRPRRTRLVWAEAGFHVVAIDEKTCMTFPRSKENRSQLPLELRLPFFFHMTLEDAKSHFAIDLVKEDSATYTLGFTPRDDREKKAFSGSCYASLILDKRTFLPEALRLYSSLGDKRTFRVTKLLLNAPVADEAFQFTGQDGWTVFRHARPLEEYTLLNILKDEIASLKQEAIKLEAAKH